VSTQHTERGPVVALALVLALGTLVLAFLLLPPDEVEHPVSRMLASVGATMDLPAEAEIEWAEAKSERLSAGLVSLGDDRLRVQVVEGLDPTRAEASIAEQRQRVTELFEDRQAPYPGQLSHTLSCPEAYRPETLDPSGEARLLMRLYANDRMAFGGCSDDLLRYRATVGLFYDPNGQRLLRLEYFTPKDAPVEHAEAALRSLRFTAGVPASAED
jgi:hypothetical protein